MLVTLLGIVKEVKEEQPEKAYFPIPVTSSPMIYSVTCEPNIREILEEDEYALFTIASELIVTEVKLEQSLKLEGLILVTLLGIITDVKEEQPQKAKSPKLVTLSPILSALIELTSSFQGTVFDL